MSVLTALHIGALAQRPALPDGLSQYSSVEELINWLDANGLANARIGVETEVSDDQFDPTQLFDTALSEEATFSQGFRLKSLVGCKLTLRNEDLQLLELLSGSYNPEKVRLRDVGGGTDVSKTYFGELVIPLSDISLKKSRKPFRHTRKTEKARLFGTWRALFRVKNISVFEMVRGKFSERENVLIGVRSHQDDQFYNSLWGETLRFTFDEKDTAIAFYQVFRRAIEICSK